MLRNDHVSLPTFCSVCLIAQAVPQSQIRFRLSAQGGVKYAHFLGIAIKIVASAQFVLSPAAEAVESSRQFSE